MNPKLIAKADPIGCLCFCLVKLPISVKWDLRSFSEHPN